MRAGVDENPTSEHKSRLMLVLDWQSLGLPLSDFWQIENISVGVACERFGASASNVIRRLYVNGSDELEMREQLHMLHNEGMVQRWRLASHRGVGADEDWSDRLRKDVLQWCVHDKPARPRQTGLLLVSNRSLGRRFIGILGNRGVDILQMTLGSLSEEASSELIETLGERRLMGINRGQIGVLNADE